MPSKTLVKKEFSVDKYITGSVEVDSMLVVTSKTEAKLNIVAELKELAKLTKTELDDKIIVGLEQFLIAANAALAIGSKE